MKSLKYSCQFSMITYYFSRVNPKAPVESSDPKQKLSALELAAFYDCMQPSDSLAIIAEFTDVPPHIKEVLNMESEGYEESAHRMEKLFSLLKLHY